MVRVCSAQEFRQGLSFCAVRAIWALAGASDVPICASVLGASRRRAAKRWLEPIYWEGSSLLLI